MKITGIIVLAQSLGTSEMTTLLSGVLVVLTVYILVTFVLMLVRHFLDVRLRKTMVERETPRENITLLLSKDDNQKLTALKWCCLCVALALGLVIVSFFQPFGIHSVVILTLSLALGFYLYYLLLKRREKS